LKPSWTDFPSKDHCPSPGGNPADQFKNCNESGWKSGNSPGGTCHLKNVIVKKEIPKESSKPRGSSKEGFVPRVCFDRQVHGKMTKKIRKKKNQKRNGFRVRENFPSLMAARKTGRFAS